MCRRPSRLSQVYGVPYAPVIADPDAEFSMYYVEGLSCSTRSQDNNMRWYPLLVSMGFEMASAPHPHATSSCLTVEKRN
jgi:hypothetical protein